ncbi:MAG TPA: addiction module protein [Bryobacteraceae bacterium]|nr:addiction module protein [Bryobacteraceae bacterium]
MAAIDISQLSIEEKWERLDELWESIYESPEAVALTEAQREELDRRIEELDREIQNGVTPLGTPFREALKKIRKHPK